MTDDTRVIELAERWRSDLQSWALPQEILDQAEIPPWSHPVAMFTVGDEIADSPSHRAARGALPPGGSVLDIGCGGGRAAMALIPPAGTVVGVDHQQEMLDEFADAGVRRGVVHHEYLGDWPDVSDFVPEADVVVCHHVVYNVQAIVPFIEALDAHARRRVVLELPTLHPLSNLNPLWRHFWDLQRPVRPSADDLLALIRALGHDAHMEVWRDPDFGHRSPMSEADRLRFTRIRLCLPADREVEVAQALRELPPEPPRELATIWWD